MAIGVAEPLPPTGDQLAEPHHRGGHPGDAIAAEERHATVPERHRSYRRLRPATPRSVAEGLALLVLIEAALVVRLHSLSSFFGHTALALVPPLYPRAVLMSDSYLGFRLKEISFVQASPAYWVQLVWLGGAVLVIVVALTVRQLPMPARVLAGFAAGLIGVSAYYVLVAGQPGFDGDTVSRFYVRTATTIWLLLPVLLTMVSLAVPFTLLERVGLLVGCLVIDVVFSIVRYAFFVWVLGRAGPIPMPMLYLLLGPPLDFVYVVATSSIALAHLARRLGHRDAQEAWSWT